MRFLRTVVVATAMLGLASLGLAQPAMAAVPSSEAAPPSGTTFFSDFDATGTTGVTVGSPDLDGVSTTTAPVTWGTQALELNIAPVSAELGVNEDLPATFTLDFGSALQNVGFSGHEIYGFDVMSNNQTPNTWAPLTITDAAGHTYQHLYRIPTAAEGYYGLYAYNGYVSAIQAGGVNVDSLKSFTFRAPREAQPYEIVLDTFRLVNSYPYDQTVYQHNATPGLVKLMNLGGQLDAAASQLGTAMSAIPLAEDATDQSLRSQGTGFGQQVTALRGELASDADDPAAAGALLAPVQALTREIGRFENLTQARGAATVGSTFGVTTADSMSLVYPQTVPCSCDPTPATLKLAKGEFQDMQLVAVPFTQAAAGVRATVTGIRSAAGGGPVASDQLSATIAPVGSVKVNSSSAYTAISAWEPDPIRSDLTSLDIPVGSVQPYWLEVHASTTAPAGDYRVSVQFTAGGDVPPQQVSVPVTVWPFAIDTRPLLPTMMTYEPTAPEQLYGATTPAQQQAVTQQQEAFLEQYMIEPDNIYASTPPSVSSLEYLQNNWGLQHFCVLYINPADYNLKDPASWPATTAGIVSTIQSAMTQYQAAGLASKAYIYAFDEATSSEFPMIRQVLTTLKQDFPTTPIVTTLRDDSMGPDSGLTNLVDIWAPQMNLYQQSSADAAHARGDQVYWYSDLSTPSPYPNFFNGYPGVGIRTMMGPMTERAGIDGYLYYKVDRWINSIGTSQPLMNDGILSNWNALTNNIAGDGSLYYPGPNGPLASIRLANFRDGMQDYNMLQELATLIKNAKTASPAELTHATTLLKGDSVVVDDITWTQDPTVYRSWLDQVASEIVALQGKQ